MPWALNRDNTVLEKHSFAGSCKVARGTMGGDQGRGPEEGPMGGGPSSIIILPVVSYDV